MRAEDSRKSQKKIIMLPEARFEMIQLLYLNIFIVSKICIRYGKIEYIIVYILYGKSVWSHYK